MNIKNSKIKLLITVCVAMCFSTVFAKTSTFNAEQTAEIESIVHDYLVNKNPGVLIEASRALQEKQIKTMEDRGVSGAKKQVSELLGNKDDIIVGNPKGTITLIEFFDYNCSHCREMAKTLDSLIQNNKDLRVIYKDLPIFGAESEFAAKVGYAAYKEGKYLEFHDAVLNSNKLAERNFVKSTATDIGLKWNSLEKTMKQNEKVFKTLVKDNTVLAQNMMDVIATPVFVALRSDATSSSVIEFRPGGGSLTDLQAMIDRVRKG